MYVLERRPLKRRSLLFIVWLLFYLIFLGVATVNCFATFITRPKDLQSYMQLGIGILYVINVMSALAIWHWWKWGFFALGASIFLTVLLTIIEATFSFWWIVALVVGYIGILLFRPRWYYFE